MAEKTEMGFTIPEYLDIANIPGMVNDNVVNAEKCIKEILKNVSSLDAALQVMNNILGVLSDELDDVNGVSG